MPRNESLQHMILTRTTTANRLGFHCVSSFLFDFQFLFPVSISCLFLCFPSRSYVRKLGRGLLASLCPPFLVCDIVMVPTLLPSSLYSCEIKSGTGLGVWLAYYMTRLLKVHCHVHSKQEYIEHVIWRV